MSGARTTRMKQGSSRSLAWRRRPWLALVALALLGAPHAGHAEERDAVRSYAIAIPAVRWAGNSATVELRNPGSVSLEDVKVEIRTQGPSGTARRTTRVPHLGAGAHTAFALGGLPKDAEFVLVRASDSRGWAAARCTLDLGTGDQEAQALALEVAPFTPPVVGAPWKLVFTLSEATGRRGTRSSTPARLTLDVPEGLELGGGDRPRMLRVRTAKGPPTAEVRIHPKTAGPHRIRAVARVAGRRAVAGLVFDVVVGDRHSRIAGRGMKEGRRDAPFATESSPRRSPAYETAIREGLTWLAAHQSPDGGWEAAGFHRWCDHRPIERGPDGLGKTLYDPGVTGLALCAFLDAGYTNRGTHPFAQTVSRGLRYLKNVQDVDGCFGPKTSQHYVYNHGIATLAMIRVYGMNLSPIFEPSARRALQFVQAARNPYFAWRYGVKPGDNDTSVTSWMIACLHNARLVNEHAKKNGRTPPFQIDEGAFEGARTWLDKMTDPDYGRVGYVQRGRAPARPPELVDVFPGHKSESMTAAGMLMRIRMGEDPRSSPALARGAGLLSRMPPTWNRRDGSIDMYYWYFGTLAMAHMGGSHWRTWRRALERSVLARQRKDTDACMFKGSWDPVGPWGPDGGRVYATALSVSMLQAASETEARGGAK